MMDIGGSSPLVVGSGMALAIGLVAFFGDGGPIGRWFAAATRIFDESMYPDVHVAYIERQAQADKEGSAMPESNP